MLRKGVSAPLSLAIMLPLFVAASVFVALYIAGLLPVAGFGTQPIKLVIYGPVVNGNEVTIFIRNDGNSRIYISEVLLNNLFCLVKEVYDASDPSSYNVTYSSIDELMNNPFKIDPQETVVVVFESPIKLKAGMTYQIKVVTDKGLEFMTEIYVNYVGTTT